MTRGYRATRTIDAPRETVWRLLTDADGYARWNEAVISLDGPIEHGGTIRLVSVVDPKRTFSLDVTRMDAPATMVWSDGMPLGLFTGERTYTLDERDDGGTTFTMVEEFTGPLAGLMARVIPDLTASFELFADSLAAAAEAQARG